MSLCPSVRQNGLQASNSLQRCWLLLNKAPRWFKSSRLLATGSTTEPPDRGGGQQKFTSMPSESCFMSRQQPRRGGREGKRWRAVTPSSLATHTVKNTVFLEGEFCFRRGKQQVVFFGGGVVCGGNLASCATTSHRQPSNLWIHKTHNSHPSHQTKDKSERAHNKCRDAAFLMAAALQSVAATLSPGGAARFRWRSLIQGL